MGSGVECLIVLRKGLREDCGDEVLGSGGGAA